MGSEIFGVPINLQFVDTKDFHINEEAFMQVNNIYQYMFENIDLYNQKFKIGDGKALAQMLDYYIRPRYFAVRLRNSCKRWLYICFKRQHNIKQEFLK